MRELNAAYAQLRAPAADGVAADPFGRPGRARAAQSSSRPGRSPGRARDELFSVSRPRARRWLAGSSYGQRLATVAIGLAIHTVTSWSTSAGSGTAALEALAFVLGLGLQASWTPAGCAFAPARDLRMTVRVLLRAVAWIASRW